MRSSLRAAKAVSLGVLLAALGCGGLTPASLEFVDTIPAQPRIGDVTTVRFRAIDNTGQPMAGASVDFSIPPANNSGGVTLSPPNSLSNRGDGIASTQIIASGQRPASVVVQAKSGNIVAVSPSITFSGTTSPSGRQFTFQCGSVAGQSSGGVHAIGAYDQTRYLIAGVKLQCFAHVADRNGTGIPNVLVSFMTEAGTIGASGISMSDVVGDAEVLYKTSYPLPKDVAPGRFTFTTSNASDNTGSYLAPLWMHPFSWEPNPIFNINNPMPNGNEPNRPDPIHAGITNNPRDNLVAMIAVTAGEEGYTDVNNNGQWDPGEPFDDLTEPFVDANDNGTWDPDERWIDTNGNGRWDGKNNTWDGNALIWVQERIIWTGVPAAQDIGDANFPVFGQVSPVVSNPAFLITHTNFQEYKFALSDPWFNSLAQNGSTDGCGIPNIDGTKLVNVNPTEWARGIRFTYPSFTTLSTIVSDAHDQLKNPPDPAYGSPLGFSIPAVCQFTASPDQGYQVVIGLSLTGRVQ
ncbi:MAG TPA: hypothetical protein VFA20_24195 [Myxococcaceae bacterium]|nr:hypothetical protein [Myxococcaceae bacterium]